MTGSFKERGALNKILTLTAVERERGLIAASAGNHAQAVSFHASKRGIGAQICMPLTTPLNKVMSTRRYGADVILHGANYDEACEEALRRCADQGLTFVHPFDDHAVIAGQGTLGLELLEQIPDLEVVIASIGGGGLISGLACALKETNPKIRVIGVQTARLPSMRAALGRQASGCASGFLHARRWHCGAPRRQPYLAPGAEIRGRHRDRRGRGNRQRDSSAARTREDTGGRCRRGAGGRSASAQGFVHRQKNRGHRLRRQSRRLDSLAHHRARTCRRTAV